MNAIEASKDQRANKADDHKSIKASSVSHQSVNSQQHLFIFHYYHQKARAELR